MIRNSYKYKDSGIEWLGKVPDSWSLQKLKFFSNITMGQSPSSDDYSDDEDMTPFLQGNADFTERYPAPKVYCDKANKIASQGSILLSVRAPVGALNEANQEYGIGRGLCAVKPGVDLFHEYIWYQLHITRSELESLATGSTYDAVSVDEVADMSILIPSMEEQQSIAAFLDQETARIDALIQKKERMIELLKEKRIALITQAVTKGLDPTVKMKDSGIEWLGEVPEHWEVMKIKHVALFLVSNVDKKTKDGEAVVRLINYTDVYNNEFLTNKMNLMQSTAPEYQIDKFGVLKDDIIITKDSEDWTDIAKPALVKSTASDIVCGYHLAIIRSQKSKAYGCYVFRALQSTVINHQFQIKSNGITRFGLPKSGIGDSIILIPSLVEQQTIASFLDRETANIDSLIQKQERAIELLREYRASLIHHAVTGKIDLRDYDVQTQ